MMARRYIEMQRYAEAEGALRTAENLGPDDLRIKMNLGNVIAYQGRYEEAIPYFRAILNVAPDWTNARQSLCYSLLQIGRPEEAKKVREESRRITGQIGNNGGTRITIQSCPLAPAIGV